MNGTRLDFQRNPPKQIYLGHGYGGYLFAAPISAMLGGDCCVGG
jgi:hypothetical protein